MNELLNYLSKDNTKLRFNIHRPRSLLIQHLIKILAYKLFVYEQVTVQQQQNRYFLLEMKILGHVGFRNIDFKISRFIIDRYLITTVINDAKDHRLV